MPISFTNNTVTPIGLWDIDSVHHVAGPMGGTVTIEPAMESQEAIDLLGLTGDAAVTELEAPVNTEEPEITGTTEVGQTLTTTNGTWTGTPMPTYAHQWRRGDTDIDDETGTTYLLVEDDEGENITCVVTATNSVGTETATSNSIGPVAGIAPSFTVDPVLTGTPTVGETLTVTNGTAGGTPAATFARVWLRDGTAIDGAAGTTRVLTEDDADALISVRVTATNSAGSDVAISNELGPAVAAEPEA